MRRNYEFNLYSQRTETVPSTWKADRDYASKQVQTEPIKFTEQETSITAALKSVQTDLDDEAPIIDVNTLVPPYPPSVYNFFSKVTDKMCQCLEENMDPFAVEVFKDCGDADDGLTTKEAKKEFTLRSSSVPQSDFGGSCIGWNRNGTQIAMGYCAHSHEAWCSHRIPVSLWNLRHLDNSKSKEPYTEIFLPSCATAMKFHPFHPSVVAVGLYSGSLAILDFSNTDTAADSHESEGDARGVLKIPSKKIEQRQMRQLGYFVTRSEHTFPITSVQWLKLSPTESVSLIKNSGQASQYCVLTSGKDGYICLWSLNTSNTKINLEKKFIVWADSIPSDAPLSFKTRAEYKQLGIMRMTCCKDDPFSCLIATYGGFIFQVNLDSNFEAYSAKEELGSGESLTMDNFLDPLAVFISTCKDYPMALDCSPFHRNIFLVGNSQGKLEIMNLLEPGSPLYQFDLSASGVQGTLNDAKWSARPTMFGICFEKSIQVFDLRLQNKAAVTIRHDSILTQLSFNDNEIGTFAACDEQGFVHVWNLPKSLSSWEPQELDVLMHPNPHIEKESRSILLKLNAI